MAEFRLIQISDTHLARDQPSLITNFHHAAAHVRAARPDLVVNSGDIGFDGPAGGDDLAFAKSLHDAIGVECRYIPGNHDVGDNPTATGPRPHQAVTEATLAHFIATFGDDRWSFDAAGWKFIGVNALVMNTGLAREAEQFDWLASQLSLAAGKPVALFIHKPLYLNRPDDPELAETAIRYVPQPSRERLLELLRLADVRLVASGHVHQRRDFSYGRLRHIWAPSAGFVIGGERQHLIGVKETGLVEYRFQPDAFEVRFVRAPGQTDIDLSSLSGY